MRTPAPLVYTSTRRPAFKRRRLSHTIESGCQSGRALTDNSNVALSANTLSLSVCSKLSCSTCHRVLSTAIRPNVAGPLVCSRCSAPTCAICARTCTSYTRPSSLPPTPALTRSPSPTTQAPTPVSPKRVALSLSYAAMNCDLSLALAPPPVPSSKRKKAPIDKEDLEGDGDVDSTVGHDHLDVASAYSAGADTVVIPGCGRVVCRACCIESVPNDGKLCVDCFAFV